MPKCILCKSVIFKSAKNEMQTHFIYWHFIDVIYLPSFIIIPNKTPKLCATLAKLCVLEDEKIDIFVSLA